MPLLDPLPVTVRRLQPDKTLSFTLACETPTINPLAVLPTFRLLRKRHRVNKAPRRVSHRRAAPQLTKPEALFVALEMARYMGGPRGRLSRRVPAPLIVSPTSSDRETDGSDQDQTNTNAPQDKDEVSDTDDPGSSSQVRVVLPTPHTFPLTDNPFEGRPGRCLAAATTWVGL